MTRQQAPRLGCKRSAWRAWWQLVLGPGPLVIRILIWSQRNARAEECAENTGLLAEAEDNGSIVPMAVSPAAEDALLLDTSDLTIGQAVQRAIELVNSRTEGGISARP